MAQVTGLDAIVDHYSDGPEHFLPQHHLTVKSSLPHRRRWQAPHKAIYTAHYDHDVGPTLLSSTRTSPACYLANDTVRSLPPSPLMSSSAFTARARCCHLLAHLVALQQVGNGAGKSATPTEAWHIASIATPTTDLADIDGAVNATVPSRICYSKYFPYK
ncbi:hypothetical protein ACLOJK_004048 [Asimina triloba]